MMPYFTTLRDYAKQESSSVVFNIVLSDWRPSDYPDNHERLFVFMQKVVTLHDLWAHGYLVRATQKRPTSSIKITYYHPTSRLTHVFVVPFDRLEKDYLNFEARQFIAYYTDGAFYKGEWPVETQEVLRAFATGDDAIFDYRYKTNQELLDIINKRNLEELGDKAWKEKRFAEVVDIQEFMIKHKKKVDNV